MLLTQNKLIATIEAALIQTLNQSGWEVRGQKRESYVSEARRGALVKVLNMKIGSSKDIKILKIFIIANTDGTTTLKVGVYYNSAKQGSYEVCTTEAAMRLDIEREVANLLEQFKLNVTP